MNSQIFKRIQFVGMSTVLQRAVVVSLVIAVVFVTSQCSKFPTELQTPNRNSSQSASEVSPIYVANGCDEGQQNSGAFYRICVPGDWNGDLVVYAHGFVDPNLPVGIPEDQLVLPDGTSIPETITQLGYAFATTSYSKNGLAVKEGIADVVDLVDIFKDNYGEPDYTYLVGASEGGLVATLSVENFQEVFDGGLAACGPIGNFRKQLNYFGDFRVVFDYFFPTVIPGTAIDIPQIVMDNWETVYIPNITAAVTLNPNAADQLLRVTKAAIDLGDPTSNLNTIIHVLWYNVFATNEAQTELGGQPFDNRMRVYTGSDDDLQLNQNIQRFKADRAALNEIEAHYQTSGGLPSPLVTIHTIMDEIVPYWHEPRYRTKVLRSGSSLLHNNIPIVRYGHSNFEVDELLAAFAILVFKVTNQDLLATSSVLQNTEKWTNFLQLARKYGAMQTKAVKQPT